MRGKSLQALILLVLVLNGTDVLARGGHGGGGHGGGWFGGGRSGGSVGYHGVGGFPSLRFYGGASLLFWPSYYYWPYFSYPAYYSSVPPVQPTSPPIYIEQERVANPNPPESTAWSFCPTLEAYYPHVKECPTGWQPVAPQPMDQEPGYWYYCKNPSGYYPYVRECSLPWQKIVP